MINEQPDLHSHFKNKQTEFTSYIRDPENNPLPDDVKIHRMAMYRELMFNNINDFLSSNFPVLYTLIEERHWYALVQDFFLKHQCKSPYFTDIPQEFIKYLQHERSFSENDPPFMLELAHYEWVEMALEISKECSPVVNADLKQNPFEHSITLSPLAWPLVYQYPVQKISPSFKPMIVPENPTYFVVYRNHDDRVIFTEITAMTYSLLNLIQENGTMQLTECVELISLDYSPIDTSLIHSGAVQIVKELADKGIIY